MQDSLPLSEGLSVLQSRLRKVLLELETRKKKLTTDSVDDAGCQGIRVEIRELFFHGVLLEPTSRFVEYADRYCWRPVFHEVITAMRARLRANATANEEKKDWVWRRDARLYRLILHEAMGYWGELARRLILQLCPRPLRALPPGLGDMVLCPDQLEGWTNGEPFPGGLDLIPGETLHNLDPYTRYIISYCYIALGDITRYRELISRRTVKKWDGTLKMYLQALKVDPDQGRALHQMALTHQQTQDTFTTHYFYYLCQVSKKPHQYGRKNFIRLLRSMTISEEEVQEIVSMEERVKMAWLRIHRHWYLEGTLGPEAWRDSLLEEMLEALKDRYIQRDTLSRMVTMHLCILVSPHDLSRREPKVEGEEGSRSLSTIATHIIPAFTIPLLQCLIDTFLLLLGEERVKIKGGESSVAPSLASLRILPALYILLGWAVIQEGKEDHALTFARNAEEWVSRLRRLIKMLGHRIRAWRKDLRSRGEAVGESGHQILSTAQEILVRLPEEKEARWIHELEGGYDEALRTQESLDARSCTVEQETVIRLNRVKRQALALMRQVISSYAVKTTFTTEESRKEEEEEEGEGEEEEEKEKYHNEGN